MNSEHTFPTLRLAVVNNFRDLKRRYDSDPHFLRQPDCPYDPETIDLLEQILVSKEVVVEKVIEKVVEVSPESVRGGKLSGEDQDVIEKTVTDLLKELNTLGEGEKGLDTQTKIQIIKAKAGLIDQVLKSHERIMNVKQVAAFHTVVISILDDFVGEEDRQAFLKRMEPYLD